MSSLTVQLVALAGFVGVGALILRLAKIKVAIAGTPACTVQQIPDVFDRLKQEGKDGSFAVFMLRLSNTSSPDNAIDIQFSIEDGRMGLDWCLIGAANIRDREKVVHLITDLGYSVTAREQNKTKYLRVDQGDLPQLCQKIITQLYAQPSTGKLDMVVEGFSWPS
jgi:hypothetical protein